MSRSLFSRLTALGLCAALFSIAAGSAKAKSVPETLAGRRFLTLPGRDWKLLWHDEFDGDRLDESRWSVGLPWIGDDGTNRHHNRQYASAIADDDVKVYGGALHLTTQRREIVHPNGAVYRYSEGLITTSGKFQAEYGYFEIRAKLPTEAGPGTWPAFWMLSKGWPPEMDVIEYWGSDNRIHQGTVTRRLDGGQRWDSYHQSEVSLNGWRTFGLEWGPGYQIYNVDGKITNAIYGGYLPSEPFYLLLNSGIESNRPPRPGTTFPNDFVVDYARVYARPDVPALLDGGFEDPTLGPWRRVGETAVVEEGTSKGGRVLRADGGISRRSENSAARSGAEQTVCGLKPGGSYRLSARVRTTGSSAAFLGAKGANGAERLSPGEKSAGWKRIGFDFTLGPDEDAATALCAVEGDGAAFFDDVRLERLPDSGAAKTN
jgi:beta-glucanase (GH16 family)